ncbi:MAG: SCP2 sterol-binding domain-containing protein [Actinomycetota bacterium]|nr:SCP2 sterol-binding domain-containing protein [Actinomycetota bacterium]
MASVADCEQALHTLAARLAGADPATKKKAALDRSMTCTLRDLGVTFSGQLHEGELLNLHQVEHADGQIKMTMTSDDLIKLVAGELNVGSAFATGRIKIDASVFDLLKLRSIF